LCTCSISTRPNTPRWKSYCLLPSATLGVQIFVATTVSSRCPSSAAPSDASARPYIGEVSKTRVPAATAFETTSRASAVSSSNVAHVPSPTTGPSLRSSIGSR